MANENIKTNPQRIKENCLFVNRYELKDINFPTHAKNGKNF